MKKILIGIPSLISGGVEVSLIRFLNELSKNKELKITLLMLERKGMYLDSVPKNIEIKEIKYTDNMYNYYKSIKDIKDIKGLTKKIEFFKYRNKLRVFQKKEDWESYYNLILSKVELPKEKYDLAIDWHGYGNFITAVISEINAKKRAMWIHDEKNEWINNIEYCLDKYDKIFCVGKSCLKNILKRKEYLKDKLDVFYNMTDYKTIRKKANEKLDFYFDNKKINIITVGRLEWQKAYDIAIEIANNLKNEGINFCWNIIGGGTQEQNLKKLVKEKGLEENIHFLGIISNPFPYVKKSDIYVLCSRHEGYCLATLEAKILGKVIFATNIESNKEQIENGKNGFLCELEPKEFANKIIKVTNDKKLMQKVKNNLEKENFDNTKEFDKLYKLMESK